MREGTVRTLRLLVLFVSLAACTAAPDGRSEEQTLYPDAPPIAPFTECSVYTARERGASFAHEPACAALDVPSIPPTGGTHYASWAAFRIYDAPVPWGFLIHSMEHGAVVIAYRCEDECPEIMAALEAVVDAFPDDPRCEGHGASKRLILVPDPTLEHAIVAVAWERMYLATCLDVPSLEAFVDASYGQGREDLCHDGVDLEATGWCP